MKLHILIIVLIALQALARNKVSKHFFSKNKSRGHQCEHGKHGLDGWKQISQKMGNTHEFKSHEDIHAYFDQEGWENYRSQDLKDTLLYSDWEPIRIHFDYSNVAQVDYNFIKYSLMDPIKEIFQSFLNIKRDPNGIRFQGQRCVEATVEGGQLNVDDVDLYIYVTAKAQPSESFAAWAAPCERERGGFRATMGQININTQYVKRASNLDEAESQASTIMHEITHILGFGGGSYQFYQDENLDFRGKDNVVGQNGQGKTVLTTPLLLQYAQYFFDCDSVDGIPLEDDGGSGSAGAHWERALLGDEAMTASNIYEPKYSMFTMALLADSGWYMPDFNLADLSFFGLGEGCNFVNYQCQGGDFKEFCNKQGESGCGEDGEIITTCTSDNFSGQCMYYRPTFGTNCEDTQPGTKCFEWTQNGKNGAECMQYKCGADDQYVDVIYGGKTVRCDSSLKEIDMNGWTLNCPWIAWLYCQTEYESFAEKIAEANFNML